MDQLTTSYWPADASVALRDLTVGDMLREAAKDSPNEVALVAGVPGVDRRWTFAEMLADAERVAAALLARFSPGERVAVWAPNVPEWVLLELGAGLAGVVLVTVNPAYQRDEVAYVLGQAGASGLFLVNEWRGTRCGRRSMQCAVNCRSCATSSCSKSGPSSSTPRLRPLPEVSPDDPAQIQYTSGTTGFPKGAL